MNHLLDDSALQSPLHNGARRGYVLGAWMSCMFVLSMSGGNIPLASLLFWVMALCLPVMVYRWLRATYVADNGFTPLSWLWMQGITMFAGGALISTVIAVAYFRYINPHYVTDMVVQMIDIYREASFSNASAIAETLQNALDAGVLPSAQDVALEMFWLTMFGGSILSLITSLLARIKKTNSGKTAPKTDTQ